MKNLIYILLFFSFLAAKAQITPENDRAKLLVTAIDTFRRAASLEKVHLQLDKPYYSIGDTIWLKAYVVNAENNELSERGTIVYVDLINSKDSVTRSLRLPLMSGLAWGDISLDDTLVAGNYHIRAYTNWMRNFGEELFFDKQLTIGSSLSMNVVAKTSYTFSKETAAALISYKDLSGNAISGKEVVYEIQQVSGKSIKGKGKTDQGGNIELTFSLNPASVSGNINTTIQIDKKSLVSKDFSFAGSSAATQVEFFPEGGQMVNNIASKIAFKTLGSDGLGKEVSGYISDKENKRVAEFKSEHAGMGVFTLTPLSGNSYTATIRFADGSEKQAELPKAAEQGYILSVTQDSANISIGVTVSKELIQSGEIMLVAQHNGVVQYLARKKAGSSTMNTTLPQNRFSEGILQLTLFSADNQPVAERLAFIHHNGNRLKVTLNPDKAVYKQREKVKLNLEVTDQEGIPVEGAFSLAITDEGKVHYREEDETTIFSNLLLNSDLKGFIEQPNYYFTSVNPEKIRQLDNLLLTQGWRRFTWKEILSSSFPRITYAADASLGISGKVLTMKGKPVAGGNVAIIVKNLGMKTTATDQEGRFNFDDVRLVQGTEFNILAIDTKGNAEVTVSLDKPDLQGVTLKHKVISEENNSSFLTYLENSRKHYEEMKKYGQGEAIILDEVAIKVKKEASVKDLILQGSVSMAGSADKVLTFLDLLDCSDLANCLGGRIAGVTINKSNNGSATASARGDGTMLIVVDGVPRGTNLSEIQVHDIAAIEVVKGARAAIYGMDAAGGALIITTKKGDIDYVAYEMEFRRPGSSSTLGMKDFTFRGYDLWQEFYSPNYNTPQSGMADLRTTIYWKPDIITDTNGKATVEFNNADGTGNYHVILEGLSSDGKLGRSVYRYTVQQK